LAAVHKTINQEPTGRIYTANAFQMISTIKAWLVAVVIRANQQLDKIIACLIITGPLGSRTFKSFLIN